MAHYEMDPTTERPIPTGKGDKYEGAAVPRLAPRIDLVIDAAKEEARQEMIAQLIERGVLPADFSLDQVVEPETFVCHFCKPPKPFSSEHGLKIHIGRAHPNERARTDYEETVRAAGGSGHAG